MWREVPNHIHIMLEKAKIDARGIVIIKLAEGAIVNKRSNSLHGAGEQKCVIHHDFQMLALGQFDQLLGLRGVSGEGLFNKYVLAVLQSGLGEFVVRPYR